MRITTRRTFLLNGFINLATFTTGGTLLVVGKKKVGALFKGSSTQEPGAINDAADVVIGGVLGLAVKNIIETNIKLSLINKELSTTVSKLQKLESADLPGIKKTLEEFIKKEGIRYEANENADLSQVIAGLLNAILIYVDSQKPFFDELKKLNTAFAQPFSHRLEQSVDMDSATQEAMMQVLRNDKLIEYLVTVVINELKSSGSSDEIGRNTIESLKNKDLVSPEGVAAFKQTVAEVFGRDSFKDALEYAVNAEVVEYDVADRLIKTLFRKLKISLSDTDPDVIA